VVAAVDARRRLIRRDPDTPGGGSRSVDRINYQFMSPIGRRTLLKAGAGAGLGLALASEPVGSQEDAASVRPGKGDLLIRAGDSTKKPLTAADIRPGGRPILAWAMDPRAGTVRSGSRLNQVLLVRLDTERLRPATRSRAADGIVAYTAVCTHTGCEVDDWLANEQLLHCPCHGSKFDPADDARVVEGEAPRPLPALPIAVDRGRLVIAGPFTARVGFQPD
jgi:rieske iron-sulfur protein